MADDRCSRCSCTHARVNIAYGKRISSRRNQRETRFKHMYKLKIYIYYVPSLPSPPQTVSAEFPSTFLLFFFLRIYFGTRVVFWEYSVKIRCVLRILFLKKKSPILK